MEDDVCAEIERRLEIRRRERVVDDEERAGRFRGGGDRRDVDDVEQRVRRCLDPDQPRVGDMRVGVGRQLVRCRIGEPVALRLVDLREHPVRPAVHVVHADDLVAGVEQVHDRGRRAEPGRERMPVRCVLERGEALLECRPGRVRDAGVVVALVDADRFLRERRRLVDRRGERARRRVRGLAGMDRPGLEVHGRDRSAREVARAASLLLHLVSREARPPRRAAPAGRPSPTPLPATRRAPRAPRGSPVPRRQAPPAAPTRRSR